MSRRIAPSLFVPLALCLFLLATVTVGARAEEGGSSRLLLILDASGSMWGQVDGENKIVIARRVIGELVNGLPEGTEVGLIAYGHRRQGDCADIETVVPLGPLDRGAMVASVNALNPKGKTPITDSLKQAFEVVKAAGGGVTVLLISDGLDNCKGNPCATAAALKSKAKDLTIDVIAFDRKNKKALKKLSCIADKTDGEGGYSVNEGKSTFDVDLDPTGMT